MGNPNDFYADSTPPDVYPLVDADIDPHAVANSLVTVYE